MRAHVTRKLSDLHEILHTTISGSTCNVAQRASNPDTCLTFYFEVVSQLFEGFILGLVHSVSCIVAPRVWALLGHDLRVQ